MDVYEALRTHIGRGFTPPRARLRIEFASRNPLVQNGVTIELRHVLEHSVDIEPVPAGLLAESELVE